MIPGGRASGDLYWGSQAASQAARLPPARGRAKGGRVLRIAVEHPVNQVKQRFDMKGLRQKVHSAQGERLSRHPLGNNAGDDDGLGNAPPPRQLLQYGQAADVRQGRIDQQEIQRLLLYAPEDIPAAAHGLHGKIRMLPRAFPHQPAEFLTAVCQQYGFVTFHTPRSLPQFHRYTPNRMYGCQDKGSTSRARYQSF